MYQILCDGLPLYDPRDDDLIVEAPKCKLEVNTVGEASFAIYADHPHYDDLKKLRSIFEIAQDADVIFRGRMTDDSRDFDNVKEVDLEGVMAFFNDSIVRPFTFPDDFSADAEYLAAAESGNVVEFFLNWIIENHNSQVEEFQRFKLGTVTVKDKNNYLARSGEDYQNSWEVLKSKLFDSALGGYLCIRYEADGNYIDYLEDFLVTNPQKIEFGENLLDLISESDATETYSAIIPLGKKKNEINPDSTDESRLTIEGLPDGNITPDLVKKGDTIYSISAVAEYGWIYAPIPETTWEDVTAAENLQSNGVEYMENAVKMANTITVKAVDLHFSDEEIEAFRIYGYIDTESNPHGLSERYKLTRLEIDIHNPQGTVITLGDTQLSLIDINASAKKEASEKSEQIKIQINTNMTAWEKVLLKKTDELFNSKISQFSDKISFEVSGSLGSKAEITLNVNGNAKKAEVDMTKVREAFANDKTAIEISAGTITFNSGTLIINSSYFTLDREGYVKATGGTIGGWTLQNHKLYAGDGTTIKTVAIQAPTESTVYVFAAGGASHDSYADCPFRVTKAGKLYATDAIIHGDIITIDGSFKTQMDKGSLRLYYSDVLCGTINTKYWSGAATEGISLRVEEGGNYIMFSHADDTQGSGYVVDYYLNAGWSSNYDEMHIFQTSARFLSDVYFAGYTRIRSLRLFGADGEYLVGINSSGQLTVSKL